MHAASIVHVPSAVAIDARGGPGSTLQMLKYLRSFAYFAFDFIGQSGRENRCSSLMAESKKNAKHAKHRKERKWGRAMEAAWVISRVAKASPRHNSL